MERSFIAPATTTASMATHYRRATMPATEKTLISDANFWAGVKFGEKRTLKLLETRGVKIPSITEGLGEPEKVENSTGAVIIALCLAGVAGVMLGIILTIWVFSEAA
jgi:hypothetical protein